MGIVDVEAMLRRHTARQIRNWEIYAELEPFGEIRDDYRTASIVQMIANVNRGSKQKAFKLEDFLLKFGDAAEQKQQKQTPGEQFNLLRVFAKAHNALITEDMAREQVMKARHAIV